MTIPHPLPEDLAELIARRFRALADPLRVRLLDLLRDGELSVNELAERLGAGQQNVSKHLAVLADAAMVARRQDGTRVYYRIADDGVFAPVPVLVGFLGSWAIHVAGLFTDNHELLRLHPHVVEHPELTEAVRNGTLRLSTLRAAVVGAIAVARPLKDDEPSPEEAAQS